MKRFIFLLALTSPVMAQTAAVAPLAGHAYYLSASGSDANAGTAASPWASPNHPVSCNDILYASTGAYSAANFQSGKWPPVSCSFGDRVAWLECSSFAGCTISAGTSYGMYVDHSFWGVQGFEVTTAAGGGTCFASAPPSGATASIHHIIFANDIANGCGSGGLDTFSTGNYGVDYVAIVGSIAYNAAQNSANCYSGISIFQPVATDSNSGTHIYLAGNFSFQNLDPATCAGVTSTDGEGIIAYDTADWRGASGSTIYNKQILVENNMLLANGGYGLETQNYVTNPSSHATVYRRHNTIWGNNQSTVRNNTSLCAESVVNVAYGIIDTGNLVQSTRSTACPSANTEYAATKWNTSSSSGSSDSGNWYYAASGSSTTQTANNNDGNTFTFGANTTGASPSFSNALAPSLASPSGCASFSNVPGCMGTVISNFAPTAVGASAYGYQAVSLTPISDSLFPAWVCHSKIPDGLVTKGCVGD